MTRKDYALIAEALGEAVCSDPDGWNISIGQAQQICEKVADRLRLANPLFDRGKFLRACGVESGA